MNRWLPIALVALAALTAFCVTRSGFSAKVAHGHAMVIVEPRRHPMLRRVLENFDATMPPRYKLYIFHGNLNEAFARDAARGVTRRQVVFVPMGVDNLNADSYNALLKSRRSFYEKIDAENILVFQTDAIACGSSPFKIDDFEKYSYIGCPYDTRIGPGAHWGPENAFYGVGGLSFRHRSASLACIDETPGVPPEFPEDVFFSNCTQRGFRTAELPEHGGVLQAFCSQNQGNEGSFGAHKVELMNVADRARFSKTCPEANPFFSSKS
jgi:hypothetical protein